MGNHVTVREDGIFLLGVIKSAIAHNKSTLDDPMVEDILRQGSDNIIDILYKSSHRDVYDESIKQYFESFDTNLASARQVVVVKYKEEFAESMQAMLFKIRNLHSDLWLAYPR